MPWVKRSSLYYSSPKGSQLKLKSAQDSRQSSAQLPGIQTGITVGGKFISHATIRKEATEQAKQASYFGGAGGGFGAGISQSTFTNVYDPIVSSDFLEIPQDLNVRWAWYRHFYRHDAIVNRAIDLHSTLPISRIALRPPKGTDPARNLYIKDFFEKLVKRIGLLTHMIAGTREYNLTGNLIPYAQDNEDTLEGPEKDPFAKYPKNDFRQIKDPTTGKVRDTTAEERLALKRSWFDKRFGARNPDYRGWERITLLPVENIRVQTFEFDPDVYYQYIPGNTGHPYINRPYTVQDTRNYLLNPLRRAVPYELFDLYEKYEQRGQPLDLPSDPYSGSAVKHILRCSADFDELGMSALDPVLKALIHKDKLRQLNTLIVNRRMTPVRVISADDISIRDLEALRSQIDTALNTPDFSVITNYPLNWEEIGSQDRLLDTGTLSQELNQEIMIGLKVSEGLLTGDNTYGGNRISAEMMNVEYLQYRESVLERYIEDFIFKPVAWKKGFIEIDEFGNEKLLYPTVRFARLGIRDNDQLYDQMFNLYLKGSLPLAVILDLLNIDVDEAEEGIKEDMLTVRDAKFTDMWGRILDDLAAQIGEQSDLSDRLMEYLKIDKKAPAEGEERFSTAYDHLQRLAGREEGEGPVSKLRKKAASRKRPVISTFVPKGRYRPGGPGDYHGIRSQ